MYKVITIPNPKLRLKSRPVTTITKSIIAMARELGDTLRHATNPTGVGLSAIQVGKAKRLFVTYMPSDQSLPMTRWYPNNMHVEYFIDPVIENKSKEVTLGGIKDKPFLEGCLSMPGLYGPVWRHQSLEIRYLGLSPSFEPIAKTLHFANIQARVIQHEYDHLEGILFTDHSLADGLPVYEEQGEEMIEVKIAV
ncbi:hypothetical protein A3B57_03590 [Microgenomates group bacterium RIFCSPLOWO2_01_FULL_47_10]|nr:MAG: hypothetical protein A3B57_03590 [Microgenomates group bacterium RIFCSPLOWO2_01_FULL_47_10]